MIRDTTLRRIFADEDLSFAAKGVLGFVLTRPAGARIGLAELFRASPDTLDTVATAVRELARTGLVGTVKPTCRNAHAASAITLPASPPEQHRRPQHGGKGVSAR
jgi:hypothetical protein